MRELNKNHINAMKDIQKEVDAFYGRYASKEGITMELARQRVTKINIEDYAAKAKRYVKEKNFTPTANEEMRLYNVTMRINRLELLKKNIELELLALYSNEEVMILDHFTKEALYEYERLSGILGVTVSSRKKALESLINPSCKNATWSTRLRDNQSALKLSLNRELNRARMKGLHQEATAKAIRNQFGARVENSERLMVTEQARIRTQIFEGSAKQMGFEEYEYLAEPTACDICADLDGQIFKLKDMEIGVNACPMHPRCMCAYANHMDRDEWDEDLKARGL